MSTPTLTYSDIACKGDLYGSYNSAEGMWSFSPKEFTDCVRSILAEAAARMTPTGDVMDERAAFETWARSEHFDVGHKGRNGQYLGMATGPAWEAWQARAALAPQQAGGEAHTKGWQDAVAFFRNGGWLKDNAPVWPDAAPAAAVLRCGDCKAPLNDDFGCDACDAGPEDAAEPSDDAKAAPAEAAFNCVADLGEGSGPARPRRR